MSQHAAVYARISRDRDEKRIGVERQEKLCLEYAAEHWPGVPVVAYVDNDVSGTTADRPGYVALLDAVRSGQVAQIVVYEQSRLTRESDEWKRLAVTLDRAGIRTVHTVAKGDVDVRAGNRLVGSMLALIDEEEVERARARTNEALTNNAKEGRPTGRAPYGYRRTIGEDGRPALEPDPGTAAVVRRIAAELERGASFAAVCRGLEADEVPTPRGGKCWHPSSLRSVITKPSIAGLRVHRGDIVGEAAWEPIIEPDRWRRLVEMVAGERWTTTNGKRRRVTRTRRTALRRLLTGGIAVCGRCTTPLVATTQATRRDGRLPAYGCHPSGGEGACGGVSIRADLLDDLIVGAIFAVIGDREAVRDALNPSPTAGVENLATELVEVERLLADLGTDYAAGIIDRAAFLAAQETAKARAERLRSDIEAARRPAVDDDPATLADRWDDLALPMRRAVVETLIESVTVNRGRGGPRFDDDRVDVDWKI